MIGGRKYRVTCVFLGGQTGPAARGRARHADHTMPSRKQSRKEPSRTSQSATRPASPVRAGGASDKRLWLYVLMVLGAGLLAYSNGFSGPLVFDDHLTIVENKQIRDLTAKSVLFP